MTLDPTFERFVAGSPLSVVARATLEHALTAAALDALFDRTAARQPAHLSSDPLEQNHPELCLGGGSHLHVYALGGGCRQRPSPRVARRANVLQRCQDGPADE